MPTFPITGMLNKETAAGAVAKTIISDRAGIFHLEVGEAVIGSVGIGDLNSSTTNLVLGSSAAGWSSMRFLTGTAPTSPVNGDVWFDGASLKIRIAGATKTFTVA